MQNNIKMIFLIINFFQFYITYNSQKTDKLSPLKTIKRSQFDSLCRLKQKYLILQNIFTAITLYSGYKLYRIIRNNKIKYFATSGCCFFILFGINGIYYSSENKKKIETLLKIYI